MSLKHYTNIDLIQELERRSELIASLPQTHVSCIATALDEAYAQVQKAQDYYNQVDLHHVKDLTFELECTKAHLATARKLLRDAGKRYLVEDRTTALLALKEAFSENTLKGSYPDYTSR